MGEFFGETDASEAPGARELVTDFQALSADAQREVRDFVRFKKLQEQEEAKPSAPSSPSAVPPGEEETS